MSATAMVCSYSKRPASLVLTSGAHRFLWAQPYVRFRVLVPYDDVSMYNEGDVRSYVWGYGTSTKQKISA